MPRLNAFVSPEYPVLFSLAEVDEDGIDDDAPTADVSLALLVNGVPSFFASHRVSGADVNEMVESLESGDARVAVVGLAVDDASTEELDRKRPAAFISLVCADGRRITVARVLGADGDVTPERLARHVIRQITKGVQVPDLARS